MLSAAAAKFGLSVAHSRSVKPLWEILSCSKKIVSFLISKSRQNLLMYLTFVLGEIWPWKRLFFPLFFLSFFFLSPTYKVNGVQNNTGPHWFSFQWGSEELRLAILKQHEGKWFSILCKIHLSCFKNGPVRLCCLWILYCDILLASSYEFENCITTSFVFKWFWSELNGFTAHIYISLFFHFPTNTRSVFSTNATWR